MVFFFGLGACTGFARSMPLVTSGQDRPNINSISAHDSGWGNLGDRGGSMPSPCFDHRKDGGGWRRSAGLCCLSICLWLAVATGQAQGPGVPIVRDRGEPPQSMVQQAVVLREQGRLLSAAEVGLQMTRDHCELKLSPPSARRLNDREIWRRSQQAHVRIGWYYLCHKCSEWHLSLSGGYFITSDGAVATCYHVVEPSEEHLEGYLVAADDDGRLLPVTGVLAANESADTAIIGVTVATPVKPLALNTDVYPGDGAWCYSYPLGRSGYFSKGNVNRFFTQKHDGHESIRMDVSTDWGQGSSGAAVLDECGNAIGHVSGISSAGALPRSGTNRTARASSPQIIFHNAARAADVIGLVAKPGKDGNRPR